MPVEIVAALIVAAPLFLLAAQVAAVRALLAAALDFLLAEVDDPPPAALPAPEPVETLTTMGGAAAKRAPMPDPGPTMGGGRR